jgi:hypothetical protein
MRVAGVKTPVIGTLPAFEGAVFFCAFMPLSIAFFEHLYMYTLYLNLRFGIGPDRFQEEVIVNRTAIAIAFCLGLTATAIAAMGCESLCLINNNSDYAVWETSVEVQDPRFCNIRRDSYTNCFPFGMLLGVALSAYKGWKGFLAKGI